MYDINLDNIHTIVCDFDETLASSIKAVLKTLNYYHNFNLTKEDLSAVRTWNFENVIEDITRDQVEGAFASKMFFDLLEPYNDMLDAIKWLKSIGKKIVILSLGTPMNLHYKSKWIHNNLSGYYDYLILAGSEDNLTMDKRIFNYNKGCLLVDDNVANLKTSPCEFKVMSKLYTQEPTEWSEGWNGLSISSGADLINLFR